MLDNVDAENGERFVSGDAYDVIILLLLERLDDTDGCLFVIASIIDLGGSAKTTKVDFGCSN